MEIQAVNPVTMPLMLEKRYERAISNYVQTGSNGDRIQLKFKLIRIEEIKPFNVADSIRRMYEDAREERLLALAEETQKVQYWHSMLDAPGKKPGFGSDMMRRTYKQKIKKSYQRIDALQHRLPPEGLLQYNDLDMDMILGIYVNCWYSVVTQTDHTFQERRETFVLSPNGKIVYGTENRML